MVVQLDNHYNVHAFVLLLKVVVQNCVLVLARNGEDPDVFIGSESCKPT